MEAQNNQALFRCRDRVEVFPGLLGSSFRILDNLPLENAICVFGGTQCTFNNMVDFVAEHSTVIEGYQFAVIGLLFIYPDRISQRTIPTVSIMEGRTVILGPRDPHPRTRDVLRTVFQPFRLDVWVMLGAVLVFFFLLSVLKFCFSTQKKKRSFYNYLSSMCGEVQSDTITSPENASEQTADERKWTQELQEEFKHMSKVSGTALGLAFAALLTVIILFYEIAIVNYVFIRGEKQLEKDVQNLTPRELSKYMVMANTAHEKVCLKMGECDFQYHFSLVAFLHHLIPNSMCVPS